MSVPVPPHYCQTLVLSVFLILYFRYRYVVISHVVLICDPNLNFLIIFNFFYYSLHTSYISFRCTTMLDIYVAYKVITSMSLMPSWYHSYDNITDCSLCGTLRPCDSNWQSVLLNPPPPPPPAPSVLQLSKWLCVWVCLLHLFFKILQMSEIVWCLSFSVI